MIFLFLAIACSSSIALIFKYTEQKNLSRYQITTFNYLAASIISFVMAKKSGHEIFMLVSNPINALMDNFSGNITGNGTFVLCVCMGAITGIYYLVGFILYQKTIRQCGASLASMFNRMGILIPMIAAIFIWGEMPTIVKWIGIIINIIAIIVVNIDFGKSEKHTFKWNLLLMFLVAGLGELSNKLFQKYGIISYKNHFMFYLFTTSFIVSLVMMLKDKNYKFSLKSSVFGVIVGVPNMLTTFFIIEALNKIQATIVYPAFSAGTIVIIMIFSMIFYKEKLKKKELFSLILTVIGIAMVNL